MRTPEMRKRWSAALLIGAGALYTLSVFLAGRPPWLHWVHELVPILVPAAAAIVCARAALRSGGPIRVAWWLFSAGAASWAAGDSVFTVLDVTGHNAVTPFKLVDV